MRFARTPHNPTDGGWQSYSCVSDEDSLTATNARVVPALPAHARWLGRSLVAAVLAFFSVFFVLPLAWLLLAPTKTTPQLNGLNGEQPFSFGSFDQVAQNWNILVGLQDGIIWAWLGNSVLYSGVALVITIIVAIPAGYALAMTNFAGRRVMLSVTLMVMLIPNTALALPIFLELSAVHLVNTPLAVILPFSFFPFGVYLAYVYFSTTMSHELLDAARIDGAGEFQVFWRIAIPLATPVIALVGFFNFVNNWNNYFLPFIMETGSTRMPVQVGLAELMSSARISPPQLALATLISVAPVLIVFLFSQRFLVTGLTAGATKE
ncbi:carbohydrate ABC transporter permease [soil metagenome]